MAAGCLSPDMFWAFVALCALMGVVSAWFNGPMMALVQRAVPEERLGRVMGFVTALMGLATPLGVAVGGLIAESTGVAPFFIVDGIACALIGLAIYAPKSVRELDA